MYLDVLLAVKLGRRERDVHSVKTVVLPIEVFSEKCLGVIFINTWFFGFVEIGFLLYRSWLDDPNKILRAVMVKKSFRKVCFYKTGDPNNSDMLRQNLSRVASTHILNVSGSTSFRKRCPSSLCSHKTTAFARSRSQTVLTAWCRYLPPIVEQPPTPLVTGRKQPFPTQLMSSRTRDLQPPHRPSPIAEFAAACRAIVGGSIIVRPHEARCLDGIGKLGPMGRMNM